jgi:CyaY protein
MLDEQSFRSAAEAALNALFQHLIAREEQDDRIEVEEQNGLLQVLFDEPSAKFVITPNAPMRQIWISALSTSFKLDWDEATGTFALSKTGESIIPLLDRLIEEHLES